MSATQHHQKIICNNLQHNWGQEEVTRHYFADVTQHHQKVICNITEAKRRFFFPITITVKVLLKVLMHFWAEWKWQLKIIIIIFLMLQQILRKCSQRNNVSSLARRITLSSWKWKGLQLMNLSQLASKRTLFVDLPFDGKKSKERPFGCLSLGIHAIIQTKRRCKLSFFFFSSEWKFYLMSSSLAIGAGWAGPKHNPVQHVVAANKFSGSLPMYSCW